MTYTLPRLPYEYDALEPYIDARTMSTHYTKHHQTYVDKLNAALEWKMIDWKSAFDIPLEELVAMKLDDDIAWAVRNHWWWHLNHSLFWNMMCEDGSETQVSQIISTFWSVENFQKEFSDSAVKLFGSWWTWLVISDGKLVIKNYPNQDSPYMYGEYPVLWLDVREHAYYLAYQNRRAEYISHRRNIVNRDFVQQRINDTFALT